MAARFGNHWSDENKTFYFPIQYFSNMAQIGKHIFYHSLIKTIALYQVNTLVR